MEIIVGVLAAIVVALLLSMLLLRAPKRKSSALDTLFQDDNLREEVDEKYKKGWIGRSARFIDEQRSFFDVIFKLLLINVPNNRQLLFQADETKYSAEEIAVMQLFAMGIGVVGFFIMLYGAHDMVFAIILLFAGALGRFIPEFYYKDIAKKRTKAFIKDFPDFMDALRIPIQRGTMPPDVAFKKIAREWSGVLGDEFKRVVRQSENYGGALYVPLAESGRRIGAAVYTNFVYTFTTSMQTGVNLATYIGSVCEEARKSINNQMLDNNRKKGGVLLLILMVFFVLPAIGLALAPTLFELQKSL